MYLVIKELKLFMYLEEIPLDKQHLNRDDLQDGYPPPEKIAPKYTNHIVLRKCHHPSTLKITYPLHTTKPEEWQPF